MQLSKYIELERKPRRGLMALEWVALAYVALTLLINCSTVFIKQHSLLDVFIALAVSIVLYFAVFVWLDRYVKPTPLPAAEPAREAEPSDA